MATIQQVRQFFEQINIIEIAKQVITENEDGLLDKNRQQLAAGFDSDMQQLNPPYSAKYAKYAKKKSGTPNLYVTGLFYSSLKLDTDFKITSNVTYAKYLVKRYGENIYGVSDNNMKALQERFREKIIELYK